MGLLDKLLGRGNSSESQSDPDLVLEDSLESEFIHGEFRGERRLFQSVFSPSGDWTCLYAASGGHDETPIALLDGSNQPMHAFSVTRVENVAVSDTGTIVLTDIGSPENQELGGTLTVVSNEGEPLIEHEFDANIWNCAITDDGKYVSTATLNPDRTAYVFDTKTADLIVKYETRELNGPPQEFGRHNDEQVLFLLDGEDRYRGINFDGETVWRTEELQRKEEYERLLESDDIGDLQEGISLLKDALEATEDENEENSLHKDVADTHWEIAKKLRKEEGDSDRWWENLNQAKEYYMEILSWSDGRNGVAKVNRKQSKYHLKEGNEEMALELLQAIGDIEDEYNVDLLTETNKETIERLSNSDD